MSTTADKDEIKRRVDLVSLVSETVTLKKSGNNLIGFCPFHHNTETEALAVFPETQTWACFGSCNEVGKDAFDWVMKRDRVDFKQALDLLAGRANVSRNGNGHHPPSKPHKSDPAPAKAQYNFHRSPDVIYSYRDETGREAGQVCRQNTNGDKAIRPRYHNGKDWIWAEPEKMPLYRLPDLIRSDPGQWVHLTEGEKNADAVAGLGFVATTNAFGALNWKDRYNPYFEGRKVAIYQDNDTAGLKRARQLSLALYEIAAEIKIITPDSLGITHIEKGDISDAIDLGSITRDELASLIDNLPSYHPPDHILRRIKTWDIDELMSTTFEPRTWLINDWLHDGLTILAGKQKTGKSWFILQLLLAISQGKKFLGQPTKQTRCLLLGLEDGPGRMKDRMERLNYSGGADMLIRFSWPNFVTEKGLDELEDFITREKIGMIVTDTFTRACLGLDQLKLDQIAPILARVQEMALTHKVCHMIVDHLKKPNGAARDTLYDVYGSMAKTALADAIWSLSRDKDDMGQFTIEGRDIPHEYNFAAKFNREFTRWEMLGDYDAVVLSDLEKQVIAALVELGGKSNTQEIADHLGKLKGNVNTGLSRLVQKGRVKQLPRDGKIQPYEIVKNPD
jgi:hypothetical protein